MSHRGNPSFRRALAQILASLAGVAGAVVGCTKPVLLNPLPESASLTATVSPSPSPSVSPSSTSSPTLVSVQPSTGITRGGTTITLSGTGFIEGATVRLGDGNCHSLSVPSLSLATCVTPSSVPSTVSVTFTNSDGGKTTLDSGYRFLSPAIVSVYPSPTGAPSPLATVSVTPETFATGTSSLLLQNSGDLAAGALTAYGLESPWAFSGGSYPGTSGTCSTSLAGGASCLLQLAFAPTLVATYADSLVATYDDTSGSSANATISQAVSGTSVGPVQVAMGADHTCVVFSNGKLKCWGEGGSGQLGMGDTNDRSVPTTNPYMLSGVAQVAAYQNTTCVRLDSGKINCWGGGSNATNLGDNATHTNQNTPIEVTGITTATDLCVGNGFSCTVLSSGAVKCWGDNSVGQLGDNTITSKNVPTDVFGLSPATNVACGWGGACVRRTTGAVKCWGNDTSGELGDGTVGSPAVFSRPSSIEMDAEASAIYVGKSHACVKHADRSMKCWGRDHVGQLGNDAAQSNTATPATVSGFGSGGAGVLLLATGASNTTCVLDALRRIVCWGSNGKSQIGDNGVTPSNSFLATPTSSVYGISSADGITAVALGEEHACAIKGSSKVVCWGNNDNGELGDNSTTTRAAPVEALMTGN